MEYQAFNVLAYYYHRHKKIVWLLGSCLVVFFILGKIVFPHPNFMPDSYAYLEAARRNPAIDTWPIGYSMFLRIQSVFTRNDVVLVAIQYFFLQGCTLYFLFGLAHLLQMNRKLLYVLAFAFVVNPAAFLISNYVAADALFTGLSLLWVCLLLQLMVQPKAKLLWMHAVLLLVLFTIRYNALYYPVIALLVIAIAKLPWRTRLKGAGLLLLLLGVFVLHNKYEYKQLTGTAQFSPFGGYMLGGNALFMYSRLPKDTTSPPLRFAEMQKLVDRHMDSLRTAKKRPDSTMGIYYIWNGPQLKYAREKYSKDSTTSSFKRWATMAPFFQDYAMYLIKKHPAAYLRYFMLPNAGYYFAPPAEFLNIYNQGSDSVGREAKEWFGYKNRYVKSLVKTTIIAEYLTVINTLFNIIFGGCLLVWLAIKGLSYSPLAFKKALLLVLLLVVGNWLFSVTLAPIVFRYQLLFFILTITFGCLLVSKVWQLGKMEANISNAGRQWQAA